MKTSLKMTLACTLLGAGFLTATPRAHAALLAYEGFDYEAGNVNGEDGGTGWSAAWVSSTSPAYANVVTGTTLAYSGGDISISGSGTALSITGGTAGILNRPFVASGPGSEIYFSFLFRSVAGGGNEFSHFYLSDSPGQESSGGIGDLNTGASDFGARIINGAGVATTSFSTNSFVSGTTYLLVGRLSTDGASGPSADIVDRVELWVNPTSLTPGTADATANASTGLTIADFDVFSSRMIGFADSDEILIDELRIGTDFASVVTVPEPSVGGLTILGGASLLALCRKTSRRAP